MTSDFNTDKSTIWYAFQCPTTGREYFYEPRRKVTTWVNPVQPTKTSVVAAVITARHDYGAKYFDREETALKVKIDSEENEVSIIDAKDKILPRTLETDDHPCNPSNKNNHIYRLGKIVVFVIVFNTLCLVVLFVFFHPKPLQSDEDLANLAYVDLNLDNETQITSNTSRQWDSSLTPKPQNEMLESRGQNLHYMKNIEQNHVGSETIITQNVNNHLKKIGETNTIKQGINLQPENENGIDKHFTGSSSSAAVGDTSSSYILNTKGDDESVLEIDENGFRMQAEYENESDQPNETPNTIGNDECLPTNFLKIELQSTIENKSDEPVVSSISASNFAGIVEHNDHMVVPSLEENESIDNLEQFEEHQSEQINLPKKIAPSDNMEELHIQIPSSNQDTADSGKMVNKMPPACWIPFAYVFNRHCRSRKQDGSPLPLFDAEKLTQVMME